MRYVAFGFVVGIIGVRYARRYRHLAAVYVNDVQQKLWPITAPIESRLEARNLADTFPEEWL